MDIAIVGRELRWSRTGMLVPTDPYTRNPYVIGRVVHEVVSMLMRHVD